ncbi:unnamed protein product [Prorocentrum cordatum]|uniref:Uncharacterized protein n=1 Tax=Prorocentrum cordatum TaxID=2364126 RepID=A0ABN9T420_9DINO|nr:unnamed protein product [Polarella glacialis]
MVTYHAAYAENLNRRGHHSLEWASPSCIRSDHAAAGQLLDATSLHNGRTIILRVLYIRRRALCTLRRGRMPGEEEEEEAEEEEEEEEESGRERAQRSGQAYTLSH